MRFPGIRDMGIMYKRSYLSLHGRLRFSKLFIVLILAILCSSQNLQAQNQTAIDSLSRLLQSNIPDTSKTTLYISIAAECLDTDPVKALEYCERSFQLAKQIKYDEGIGEAAGWLAYLSEQLGQIDKAIDYYQQALIVAKRTKGKKSEATIYGNLAAIYKDQGKIEEALTYNTKSLEISIQINDKDGISTTYNNLGLLYFNQGKIEEALDYYFKALKLSEEIKNDDGIATALGNIAAVYKSMGDYDKALEFYKRDLDIVTKANDQYGIGYALNGIGGIYYLQRKLDSALALYQRALTVREKIEDMQGTAYSLKNIGEIYVDMQDPKAANPSLEKSLNMFETLGDKWGMAKVTALLGQSYFIEQRKKESEQMYQRSLQLAKELGYPADISNAANGLQQLYRSLDRWKEALLMHDLYVEMNDSVTNDRSRKAVLQTQFRYEYEKKEALLKSEQEKKDALAAEELHRSRQQKYFLIAGLIMALGFGYWDLRQKKRISIEKKRSDELLLNILPEEVADELKSTGKTIARDFDEVTVLFTDFKNFTLMSELLSAQELVNEINFCYSAFDRIIAKYPIEKIKTIGDSYMCAGGLPAPNETHAIDIVSAALEISAFVANEKNKRALEGRPYFEIRIGCHTGPVVAGIVGIKKFAYDIWGDTVNIAARMESSGETGKVNISATTYELVKHHFDCKPRGMVEAKNKGEVEMYFVG